MTMSNRDKKLLAVIIPVLLLAGYWFLVLSPKRAEVSSLTGQLSEQETQRDKAQLEAQQAEAAKSTFKQDYATVVRLGKAIPSTVDMSSLVVQLDRASAGTGIRFASIKPGPRVAATGGGGAGGAGGSAPSAGTPAPPGGSSGATPPPASAAGGQPASTGPGTAAEQANETKQSQDTRAAEVSKGGAPGAPADKSGAPTVAKGAQVPGLDSVPLEFTFDGSFFQLADFFHRLKRFVRLANEDVKVGGRLMTISGFKFAGYPKIKAQVSAVVYLSPKGEGTTAGATPSGPSAPGAAPPSTSTASSPPASPAPPSATATAP